MAIKYVGAGVIPKLTKLGERPGLVVKCGDLYQKGRGFESQHRKLLFVLNEPGDGSFKKYA